MLDDIACTVSHTQGQQSPKAQLIVAFIDQDSGDQDVPDDNQLGLVDESDDLPKNIFLGLDQLLVKAPVEAVEGGRIQDA